MNPIDRVPMPFGVYRSGDVTVTVDCIEREVINGRQRVRFVDAATKQASSCTVAEFVKAFEPVEVVG